MNRFETAYMGFDVSNNVVHGSVVLSVISDTVKSVSVRVAVVVVRIIELVMLLITGNLSLTSAC